MKMKLFIVLAGLVFFSQAAHGRFARVEVEKVPVAKLLANLEAKLKTPKGNEDKAMLEFQIGRLHSMAYAVKTEEVDIRKDPLAGIAQGSSEMQPFYGYGFGDFKQFSVTKEADEKRMTLARDHLRRAIMHLRKALELNPALEQAKLGLAWCLDQTGEKPQAMTLYRQVINSNFDREVYRGGLRGSSIVEETAGYLLALLDEKKDAAEITDIKQKQEMVSKNFRAVTPIVVPLQPGVSKDEFMRPARVTFDLDGDGPRAYSSWTASSKAGWLVYDGARSGKITSGLELFGRNTFWIFWRDGYEALSALDADNNGWIEGEETDGLAIWNDRNGNGVSEPGEVVSLRDCGIEALSCRSRPGADGFLYSEGGVLFRDGQRGDSVDWIVDQAAD